MTTSKYSLDKVVNLVLVGVGVGVSSSVIPYVCDQLAMSRLLRSLFALLLVFYWLCSITRFISRPLPDDFSDWRLQVNYPHKVAIS